MKRGTPRHPKVGRLCELLDVKVPAAIGLLELLWHFTSEFAPQGDIGKYDDARIEAALLSWFRPKGKLLSALIKSGWIDQDPVSRLIVHDWHQHADDSVRKKLSRAGLTFLTDRLKVTGHRPATLPDNGSLPSLAKPEPSHAFRTTTASASSERNLFEEFKALYPEPKRGVKLESAARAYVSRIHGAPGEHEKLMAGLQRHLASENWQRSLREDGGQFIPAMATFISDGRYLDHPPSAPGELGDGYIPENQFDWEAEGFERQPQ